MPRGMDGNGNHYGGSDVATGHRLFSLAYDTVARRLTTLGGPVAVTE